MGIIYDLGHRSAHPSIQSHRKDYLSSNQPLLSSKGCHTRISVLPQQLTESVTAIHYCSTLCAGETCQLGSQDVYAVPDSPLGTSAPFVLSYNGKTYFSGNAGSIQQQCCSRSEKKEALLFPRSFSDLALGLAFLHGILDLS